MLPIKIPRRGDDEELTLSASFALAMLLVGASAPALIAQGIASILQEITLGEPSVEHALQLRPVHVHGRRLAAMGAVAVSPRLSVLHPFASNRSRR